MWRRSVGMCSRPCESGGCLWVLLLQRTRGDVEQVEVKDRRIEGFTKLRRTIECLVQRSTAIW